MHAADGESQHLDAETQRVGILLHHRPHARRRGHDVLRQRVGQRAVHGGPHHRAVRDRAQRIARILRVIAPGPRVGDPELNRRVHRDEIAAVAEEQRVLVGGVLARPQHVFRSTSLLPS